MKKIPFDSVSLYDLLVKSAPNKVFFSMVMTILASLLQVMLIPILLMSINVTTEGDFISLEAAETVRLFGYELRAPEFAYAFAGMTVAVMIIRAIGGRVMQVVVTDLAFNLKSYFYHRVSASSIRNLEEVGTSRILAVLTTDIDRIAFGARMMPVFIGYMVMLMGLMGVLFYLQAKIFLFVLAVIVFVIATFRIFTFFGEMALTRARELLNEIIEGNRAIIYGAKELKLNEKKAVKFNKNLVGLEDDRRKKQLSGNTFFMLADQYGQMIHMLAIAVIAFIIVNIHSVSTASLLTIIMIMIYMAEPVAGIMATIEQIIPTRISMVSMRKCLSELDTEAGLEPGDAPKFNTVTFKDINYKYVSDELDRTFEVKDINLTLKRGQITYITGGNGSGKSTMGKVISMHYNQDDGDMLFDDVAINDDNRRQYRQQIAAIFTDFYLFNELYGIPEDKLYLIPKFLKELKLEGKVDVVDGKFSTTQLSDGQRKRLALLVSFLEDKDLYLFDEWAADQDPQFKAVFYQEIIPSLKAAGKIVVVITHDDRYFDLADQLVKMEYGRIESISNKEEIQAMTSTRSLTQMTNGSDAVAQVPDSKEEHDENVTFI